MEYRGHRSIDRGSDKVKSYTREKKFYCSENYMEVDIYSYTDHRKKAAKGKRSKKKKESLPAQRNLNDKNARRKLVRLGETNFGRNDISLTLTYSDEMLPATIEEAEKEVENYIRRVRRRRKKEGAEDLKYILITAYTEEGPEGEEVPVRIHHHILMNQGLDRDIVEDLWRKRRRKGEKEGRSIGYANADRIQPDRNNGIAALLTYLVKNPTGKRRWTCSQNLTRPEGRPNDHKYSRRQVMRLAMEPLDIEYWEKQYPGWTIADPMYDYEQKYNDFTGWAIYLKLRRKRE